MSSQKRVRKYRYKRRIINAIRTRESEEILSTDNSEHETDEESLHALNENFVVENDMPIQLPENVSDSRENDTGDHQISFDGSYNSSSSSDSESLEDHTSIRQWSLEHRIAGVHVDALLKILNERPLFKVPNSHKTLLGYNRAKYTIKDMMGTDSTLGEFTYSGIKRGLRACVDPLLHTEDILLLDFHIDGMKLKKSSTRRLWVILAKVYLTDEPNTYKPFPVSLFYGNGKPQNLEDYLDEFVRDLNNILITGVKIKSRRFMIRIRCFICDIPARAFVKKIKGHSSFDGCERCNIHAHTHHGTVTYLEKSYREGRWVYIVQETKRNNSDFVSFNDPNHHIGVTPLLTVEPKIDFIYQFVLDSMHSLYLGVMLRILDFLMEGDLRVRLYIAQKKELDRRTELIKSDIPAEFQRKLRPYLNYSQYKALDLKFLALYLGPIIFKEILSDDKYHHFLLFHVACRLLSGKKFLGHITIARSYLKKFVEDSITIYDPSFVTLVVHYLIHLPDDVERWKCNLNDMSAFPYENELGKMKHIFRSPHRTLAQYCRVNYAEHKILDKIATAQKKFKILIVNKKHEDHSSILLNNGSIVKIERICVVGKELKLQVLDLNKRKDVYQSLCDSSFLNISEVESCNVNARLRCVTLDAIQTKMIRFSLNFAPDTEMRTFVVPLLH
ncbi:hypothetical protein QAD02_002389 [Eretmocerus hayati]|uniref:Uncharacterized protein n=1 Tax=Eretmocerus hayati TaxID=131215 RepID=A0ACC2NNL4_9HYME|nr:hypothetical protein QAD02_002389 [Eretmocerus hayati]